MWRGGVGRDKVPMALCSDIWMCFLTCVCMCTDTPSGPKLRTSSSSTELWAYALNHAGGCPGSQPGEPQVLPSPTHTFPIKGIPPQDSGQGSPGQRFRHLRWSCSLQSSQHVCDVFSEPLGSLPFPLTDEDEAQGREVTSSRPHLQEVRKQRL